MKRIRRAAILEGVARLTLALLLICLTQGAFGADKAPEPVTPEEKLAIFKAWLDLEYPGYSCDEGPAEFRNKTVESAYPGRRFYYVLTNPKGTEPPSEKALSLVAYVSVEGEVRPFDVQHLPTFHPALIRATGAKEARLAAAAVLILAIGDPAEKRWKIAPDSVEATKSNGAWICTYQHGDAAHQSIVTFNKAGYLTALSSNPPPVP
jgi:hypothetical protein